MAPLPLITSCSRLPQRGNPQPESLLADAADAKRVSGVEGGAAKLNSASGRPGPLWAAPLSHR